MTTGEHVKFDKDHPLAEEYSKKFRLLFNEKLDKQETERAKYPDWKGKVLGNPADGECLKINKEYNKKLKALQEEYSFLFIREEE